MEKFTNITDIEQFKIITDLVLNHIIKDTTPPALCNVFSITEINEIYEYFIYKLQSINTFSDAELVQVFNEFNEDQLGHIASSVQRIKIHLIQLFVCMHNRKYTDTLKDYSWNLKNVMGTSISSTLNYPVFQINMDLMMNVSGNDSNLGRNVVFEMDSEKLDTFIDLLGSRSVLN